MDPRKRLVAKFVVYASLALIVAAIGIRKIPSLTAVVQRAVDFRLSPDALLWIPLGVGVLMLLAMVIYWRCPECHGFLGPLTATFCKRCGAKFTDQPRSLTPGVRTSATIDNEQELQALLARLAWLDRLLKKVQIGGGVLAALLAAGYFARYNDAKTALMLFVVFLLIGVALPLAPHSFVHNFMLLRLKCPHCRASLINRLETFCPECGERIFRSTDRE